MNPRGDEAPDILYQRIGQSLSVFEELQWYVGTLFRELIGFDSRVGGAHSAALEQAFGTLVNTPPRSAMIRAAGAAYLVHLPDKLKIVQGLMSQYDDLSLRRNEIAHGIVAHFSGDFKHVGHYLTPGWHSTDKNKTQENGPGVGGYAYTSDQVLHYTREFRRVRLEIVAFIDELNRNPPHPYLVVPKPPEVSP